jgi:hypothetical protein
MAMSDEAYPKYRFYVGDRFGNVGLWKRTDEDTEKPICTNTRGTVTWFSYKFDEYANCEPEEPTQDFWRALAALYGGMVRVSMTGCEWYEKEILAAVGNPDWTEEAQKLAEYATEQVNDDE